mgnify:CR=1 FL=1
MIDFALGRAKPVSSGIKMTIASNLEALERLSLKAVLIAVTTMKKLSIASDNRTNQVPLVRGD